MLDRIAYGGWPNCLRLANEAIELVVTTDVGPRVIRAGFTGGPNLFREYEDELGRTGGAEWLPYGGHRLWHAPEVEPRTYAPDNDPVEHTWDGTALVVSKHEPENRVERRLSLTLDPAAARVRVVHTIVNRGPWEIELAPWALSVMAQGGRAIVPHEEHVAHPDALHPARPVVLWHYTEMADPRWTWGNRYLVLRQDPDAGSPQKAGVLNTRGWAAYVVDGQAFIKLYGAVPGARYPDMGCNTEVFTNAGMLELETLGPLTRLEPGAGVDHTETWVFARVELAEGEAEIDERLAPLAR